MPIALTSPVPPVETCLTRYIVASSDVLADMRVNVSEEGSEKVLWYKERFLGEEEIIEHVVENATSSIQWIIHRPKRGWYIRLRTPSFPPNSFISLTPLPQSSPYHTEAALAFSCRTNVPPTYDATAASSKASLDSEATLADSRRDSAHSYPPTPPAHGPVVMVHPPSPRSVNAKLAQLPAKPLAHAVTPFLLTPHSHPHVPPQQQLSVFARMMSALKNSTPSHSASFTLSPVPQLIQARSDDSSPVVTPTALLTYHDRTPVFTIGSMNGLIELNTQLARDLGVQTSFYIAVALTYLEFLMERDSYIAATAD